MALLQSSAGTGANNQGVATVADLSIEAPNSSTGGFATEIGRFKRGNQFNNKKYQQNSRKEEEEVKK